MHVRKATNLTTYVRKMTDVASSDPQVEFAVEHSRLEGERLAEQLGRRKSMLSSVMAMAPESDVTAPPLNDDAPTAFHRKGITVRTPLLPWIQANNWLCLVLFHCLPALESLLDQVIQMSSRAALWFMDPQRYWIPLSSSMLLKQLCSDSNGSLANSIGACW